MLDWGTRGAPDWDMRDSGAALGAQSGLMAETLMAETLGVAMARRAADILERHRDALTLASEESEIDRGEFAADDAVFTAVLDAANECLGQFDTRPSADRWCDALLQVLRLAELSPRIGPLQALRGSLECHTPAVGLEREFDPPNRRV